MKSVKSPPQKLEPRTEMLRIPDSRRKNRPVPLQPLRQPPAPLATGRDDDRQDVLRKPSLETRCSTMRSTQTSGSYILDYYLNAETGPVAAATVYPIEFPEEAIAGFNFGLDEDHCTSEEVPSTNLHFETGPIESESYVSPIKAETVRLLQSSPPSSPPALPTPTYSLFPAIKPTMVEVPSHVINDTVSSPTSVTFATPLGSTRAPTSTGHSRANSGTSIIYAPSMQIISPLPSDPYEQGPQRPRIARLRSSTVTTVDDLSSPSASSTSTVRPSTTSTTSSARRSSVRWSDETISRPLLSPSSRTVSAVSTVPLGSAYGSWAGRSSRSSRLDRPSLGPSSFPTAPGCYTDIPIKSVFEDDDSDDDTAWASSARWSGWRRKLSWSTTLSGGVQEIDAGRTRAVSGFSQLSGGSGMDRRARGRSRAWSAVFCGCCGR